MFRVGPIHRAFFALVLLTVVTSGLAVADTQTQTQTLSSSFAGNVTSTGNNPLIHVPLVFNQFNGSLGTLNTATLMFNLTGGAFIDSSTCFAPDASFCFAKGSFNASAPGNSASQAFDLDSNNKTSTFSFTFSNPQSLALAGLTGAGTVTVGNFDLGINLAQALFPDAATGNVRGTVDLVYDYTTEPGIAPNVPEPASITLLLSGLGAVGALRRKLGR
jgi:hypothetical protein